MSVLPMTRTYHERVVAVTAKNVYGKTLYYPANETARTFCAMLNVKTLSEIDARYIRDLGFDIQTIVNAARL